MKTLKIFVINQIIVILIFCLAQNKTFAQTDEDDFSLIKNIEIFQNVLKRLRTDYIYPINASNLITTAINAMLKTLDPYTVYYPESKIQELRFMSEAKYVGIGIIIQKIDNKIYITQIFNNAPAKKAGLLIGDQILKVHDIPIVNKTMNQIHTLITGEPGTKVKLTIRHLADSIERTVFITRQNIKIPPIDFATIDNNIGYIKLSQFSDDAYENFYDAFSTQNLKQIKGLIIDLRNNPGGLLNEAVDILSTLLPQNTVVVTVKGKNPAYQEVYQTNRKPINTEIPVVVLVNGNSASASEIVAGALQDLDRAVIIGEQTVGKGLVQRIFDVGYNSRLKVTIAQYFIPSGRCIQSINYKTHTSTKFTPDTLLKKFYTANGRTVYEGKGIVPDIYIKHNDYPEFIVELINKQAFLFFASYYLQTNQNIDTTFTFNDIDAFCSFLKKYNFTYKTKAQKIYENFLENIDSLPDSIKTKFIELYPTIKPNIKTLVYLHKDLIIKLINLEIFKLLNNKQKYFKVNKQIDLQLKEAFALINNKERYNNILNINK